MRYLIPSLEVFSKITHFFKIQSQNHKAHFNYVSVFLDVLKYLKKIENIFQTVTHHVRRGLSVCSAFQ